MFILIINYLNVKSAKIKAMFINHQINFIFYLKGHFLYTWHFHLIPTPETWEGSKSASF